MSQLISFSIALLALLAVGCTKETPKEPETVHAPILKVEETGSLEPANKSSEPVETVAPLTAEDKNATSPARIIRKSPSLKTLQPQRTDARLSSSSNSNASLNTFSLRAPIPMKREKLFTLSAKLSTFSNLEKSDSPNDKTGSLLEIRPSIRLGDASTLSALISVEFDHVKEESQLLNTVISFSRNSIQLDYDSSLNLSAQAYLPTDKRAYDEATLRGGAGATVGVRRNIRLFSKQASIGYALNGLKNFHQFNRTNTRAANISHRLRHSGEVEAELTRKVTLSVGGYFQTGWTYENVVRDSYTFAQSVTYQVNDQFSVAAEHSTGGKFFTADGSEWNAKLFDPHDSVVGLSVSGMF